MPYPAYLDLATRYASLNAEAVAAYVRYARRPAALGADTAHLKLWAAAYEAKAALREQNPAFAATLLPTTATPLVAGMGLPLVPAGVRWAVDEAKLGTITLTVDIAGALAISVESPGSKARLTPVVTPGATRQTTTFAAPLDGLYVLSLSTNGTQLAVVYVPVNRVAFSSFREDSRALGHAFRPILPKPPLDYELRLALLGAGEAAAATGQPELAERLFARANANALAQQPKPTATYPFRDATS